jgi:hypothetical protein
MEEVNFVVPVDHSPARERQARIPSRAITILKTHRARNADQSKMPGQVTEEGERRIARGVNSAAVG